MGTGCSGSSGRKGQQKRTGPVLNQHFETTVSKPSKLKSAIAERCKLGTTLIQIRLGQLQVAMYMLACCCKAPCAVAQCVQCRYDVKRTGTTAGPRAGEMAQHLCTRAPPPLPPHPPSDHILFPSMHVTCSRPLPTIHSPCRCHWLPKFQCPNTSSNGQYNWLSFLKYNAVT